MRAPWRSGREVGGDGYPPGCEGQVVLCRPLDRVQVEKVENQNRDIAARRGARPSTALETDPDIPKRGRKDRVRAWTANTVAFPWVAPDIQGERSSRNRIPFRDEEAQFETT